MRLFLPVFALLTALLLLPIPCMPAAFVYESATEMFTTGDFDGDSAEDIVIVDKQTGAYRVAFQFAKGIFLWTRARPSGVEHVTGLTAGRLLSPMRDALVFTSAAANRITLLDASRHTIPGQPIPLHLPSIGPNLVVAVDIGGAGNTVFDDLIVASRWNGASPHRLTAIRNTNGGMFSVLQDEPIASRAERGNSLRLKSSEPLIAAFILRGATDVFCAHRAGDSVFDEDIELPGLPAGSDYVAGFFAGPEFSHFLFFRRGHPEVRHRAIVEPAPGALEFGVETVFDLGRPIHQMFTLPGPSSVKLLVAFGNGETAITYNFDGTNAPVAMQEFPLPPGEFFTGAVPLADNGFVLLSGADGRSTRHRMQDFNGEGYTQGISGSLPALNPLWLGANVLQFQYEPFVSAMPTLLEVQNAGDWTGEFILSGGPAAISARTETFFNPVQGLTAPTVLALGPAHPLAQYGLVNQYSPAISLFSFSAPAGDEVAGVRISPAPGRYRSGISISFTTDHPSHQVFFRLNASGDWLPYNNTPVANVFTNTVVAYYAKPPAGNAKSIIRTAVYEFTEGPGSLDSDNDGVPDFVEAANGLDALSSGADGDGDGFSDLEELLAGTDPANRNDHPPGSPGLKQRIGFDLLLTPRPFDGVSLDTTLAATGAVVRAYDTAGSLLAAVPATHVPGAAAQPSALLTNILVDSRQKFLVAATERDFAIQTAGADKNIGRELLRLIPCPRIPPVRVDYVFGSSGGAPADEARGWLLSASNAYHNVTRAVVRHDLTLDDSLTALLVERKLSLVGPNGAWTNLTLFPFRPGDTGRQFVAVEDLLALQLGAGAAPGHLLKPLLETLDALVKEPPNPLVQAVRDVTREIYRIGSASNNTAPGAWLPPIDVLRQFIASGTLDSNYAAAAMLTGGTFTDANNGVAFLLASVSARPVTNLNLRVRSDSFTGPCTVLESANLAKNPVRLFDSDGGRYAFPNAFQLLPGSVVRVVGYADATNAACPGFGIEVISLALEAVPVASDPDSDGNLLIDSWEKLFLALQGAGAFDDFDGDGYCNLQEMLEGSDPTDARGVPPVPVASLTPPLVSIELLPAGAVRLSWSWPEAYAGRIAFGIKATPNLDSPLTKLPVLPQHIGGGSFEATIPGPATEFHFYVITMALRN